MHRGENRESSHPLIYLISLCIILSSIRYSSINYALLSRVIYGIKLLDMLLYMKQLKTLLVYHHFPFSQAFLADISNW